MRRSAALLFLLPILHGCRDESPLRPPGEPVAAIEDAAHAGGVPGFYFLPPVVSQPAYSGTFAATLSPRVEVCVVSASDCSPTSPATEFTLTDGLGGEVIVVDPVDEHYSVEWHTDLSNLDPTKSYRIRVWLGSAQLGSADVAVVSSGSELKSADTGEQIALKDGRTLPIKFRIETLGNEDLLRDCAESSSCVIRHVSPTSPDGSGPQVVMTADGYFAGIFEDGFMDSYVDENPELYGDGVTVVIYRRETSASEPCLPFPGAQAEACGHYETIPALERGFDFPQRVEQCLDPAVQLPENYRLHKLSQIGPVAERGRVVALDPATSTEIDCTGFMQSPPILLQQVAAALLRPLQRVFGPATAYASDIRYGGLMTSYSEVGYAQPLAAAAYSGDGQAGAPGALLSSPIRVQVLQGRNEPNHSPALIPTPVLNARVTFIVVSGGGTLQNGTVAAVDSLDNFTDANGFAEVQWTLGQATGQQTVIARLAGVAIPELTFTASASSTAPTLFGPDLVFALLPLVDVNHAPFRILVKDNFGTFVEPTVDPASGLPTVNVGDSIQLESWFINSGDTEIGTGFEARMRFGQDPWMISSWTPANLPTTAQGYFSTKRMLTDQLSACETRSADADLDHLNQVSEGNSSGTAESNNTASLNYRICP